VEHLGLDRTQPRSFVDAVIYRRFWHRGGACGLMDVMDVMCTMFDSSYGTQHTYRAVCEYGRIICDPVRRIAHTDATRCRRSRAPNHARVARASLHGSTRGARHRPPGYRRPAATADIL